MAHDGRDRISPTASIRSGNQRFADRDVTRASKLAESRRTGTRCAAMAPRPHTSNIKIVGFGESEDGQRFVRLRITAVAKKKSVVVPLDGLTSTGAEAFDLLNRQRAHLITSASRQELINRIQGVGYRPPKFRVANRLGWHDLSFVLPDGVIPPTTDRLYIQLGGDRPERFDRYRAGGTFKGWKRLARLARGNSRLILAACVTLEGIVGPILGTEPVGVALVVDGETGKSAVVVFAGAFWGCHTDHNMANKLGFAVPWDATDYDIEKEALAVNHTVLLLDETRTISTNDSDLVRAISKQIFRLERGFEKGRGNVAHRRRSSHVSLLATSNVSLEAGAHGVRIDDALHGRWTEVPVPPNGHGMFEDLHGESDVPKFTRTILTLAKQHFGHAARIVINQLHTRLSKDRAAFKIWALARQTSFLKRARKFTDPTRAMDRIQQKFATLYTVGCLAAHFGVMDLDRKEICAALLSCLRDHVAHVQKLRNQPDHLVPGPMKSLQDYVARTGLKDLRNGLLPDISEYDPQNSPGLIVHHKRHGDELLLTNPQLEAIVGGRSHAQALKHQLERTGSIATNGSVGDTRFSVKRTIARPAPHNRHRPNFSYCPGHPFEGGD